MSGPELTVGRDVMREMVRLAAFEVPGVLRVGRGGGPLRSFLGGPTVRVDTTGDRVHVDVTIVARPGHALVPLTRQVRSAVGATVERLLGLQLDSVTVTVDGVGG
ncbi:MAG TPA: Asp23/Gls24 family envelope stress response protein [Candidatus Limnocylindrales bacterium]|nr:Asp23/Gls24 family envelope stress response protein [Candidatus Limnocylindrales bacterium]